MAKYVEHEGSNRACNKQVQEVVSSRQVIQSNETIIIDDDDDDDVISAEANFVTINKSSNDVTLIDKPAILKVTSPDNQNKVSWW